MRLKTGEVLYLSRRPPPKISLRHDHDWTRGNNELGSTVEQQPVGKLVQQACGEVQHATFSQLTQPKTKPIFDRSGKPDSTEDVFVVKGETSRSHEIDEKRLHKELLQEEVRKGDISIALMIREQSFSSVLFSDTLETILLILHYRTM